MGLVARVLEQAGIPTAVLSSIPEMTVSVGAPRVIGISHPGSLPFGAPGDAAGQRAVLRASLEAAFALKEAGGRVDLDFEWPPEARLPRPRSLPPIAQAIVKRPWLYLKLLNGEIP